MSKRGPRPGEKGASKSCCSGFFISEAVGQSAFQGFVNELQGGHMVNKQVTRMKYDQIKTHLTETERSVANTFTGTSSLFRQPGKIEF